MKLLSRLHGPLFALLVLVPSAIAAGTPQSGPQLLASTDPPVAVRSIRVLPSQSGPVVEILSSRPLVPTVTELDNPPRLVIDLPNADVPAAMSGNKGLDFPSEDIRRVRINQFQVKPSLARIVLDLLKPVGQTWDAAGNRLVIRLHPAPNAAVAAKPPQVPAFPAGVQPVAVPLAPGSSGALIFADSHIAAGSSVTAGSDTSLLRLERGGEVRVCPGTTVSVTSSQKGHSLMLGMNTGALEAHYSLDASADSILTPDFRILLAGPGEFHYAVSADSRGNTCVRALPGNTASVIVAELLGDGSYQVKPTEQLVFRSGRLNLVDSAVPVSCGCPPPAIPVLRASTDSPAIVPDAKLPRSTALAQQGDELKPVALASPPIAQLSNPPSSSLAVLPPETAPLPPSKPSDVHVQVEAPFVFRASDPPPAEHPITAKSSPILEAELTQIRDLPRPATLNAEVLPPPEVQAKPHRGVFARIRGFFATIFG